MSLNFDVNQLISGSDSGGGQIYQLYHLLTNLSTGAWTCVGAYYNGAPQTSVTSADDLNGSQSNSSPWFILEDPNGYQICFNRYDGSKYDWQISVSGPTGFTLPSPLTNVAPIAPLDVNGATTGVYHQGDKFVLKRDNLFYNFDQYCSVCADDQSPYNFYLVTWKVGDFDSIASMARFELDVVSESSFPDKTVYVIGDYNDQVFRYYGTRGSYGFNDYVQYKNVAMVSSTEYNTVNNLPYYYYNSGTQIAIPSFMQFDSSDKQILFPIAYGRPSSFIPPNGFCGITSFIRWNGRRSNPGETFDSGNWLSIGDVSIPWDPTVVPRY